MNLSDIESPYDVPEPEPGPSALARDLVAALVAHPDKGIVRALGRAIYDYGDQSQFGTDDQVRRSLEKLRNAARVMLR
jgi:hypothetical protein